MDILTLFNNAIIVSVCLLLGSTTIHCQNDVALDVLQRLNAQIDTISTPTDYRPQLTALNDAITDAIDKEQSDFQSITAQLDGVYNNILGLEADLENVRRRINGVDDVVTQLQSAMDSTWPRVGKLENVTMIWKANFKIVNGTFIQLAKKFKLFTPIIKIPIFSLT